MKISRHCTESLWTAFYTLMLISLPSIAFATNLKMIPIGAESVTNKGLPPTHADYVIFTAKVVIVDQDSDTLYYCKITQQGNGGVIAPTKQVSCHKTSSGASGGKGFDAVAAQSNIPPPFENSLQARRFWYPAPIWMLQPTDINTLRVCTNTTWTTPECSSKVYMHQ